jgi:predicted nuclease of predicted toxin-antitoxin system
MRFLADMNVSLATVAWLRSQGHRAVHVREQSLQRAPDEQILALARAGHFILLTMDLDFGYLMAVSGEQMPSVVLLRMGNDSADNVSRRLSDVLSLPDIDWEAGIFVTVTDSVVRVRRLPL